MKRLIQNLFCFLFILNCIIGEEIIVTTIIKNSDSTCTQNTNGWTGTGTGTSTSTGSSTSSMENNSIQKRLGKLEALFHENRATLCGAGMQDYRITDGQLSSSNFYNKAANAHHSHIHARLNIFTGAQAWCILSTDPEKWIQVDFNGIVEIAGVVTQGRGSYDQWVTLFKVQYKSSESDDFKFVQQKPFPGNVDRNSPAVTSFSSPVEGRYFRIEVLEWHEAPSMRFDFLLC